MIAAVGKVFITRAFPFAALERLQAEHDVDVWDDNAPPPREACSSARRTPTHC